MKVSTTAEGPHVDHEQPPLVRATPESRGVDPGAVSSLLLALERKQLGVHAVVIARRGAIIAEAAWEPYSTQQRHLMFSVSKSITALAVGIAAEEGLLDLSSPVATYFPELAASVHPSAETLTPRHLLAMATGHGRDTMKLMRNNPLDNWVRIFLEEPVVVEPGTTHLYDSGASFVLAALVSRVTGSGLQDYLTPRLFEPLGIINPPWQKAQSGIELGASGLRLTPAELAAVGQLLLQRGRLGGRQIISGRWVDEATAMHVATSSPDDDDWAQGYGYQFWRSRHDSYRADGAYGQFCLVVPSQDLVVAIVSGSDRTHEIVSTVWDELLPGLSDGALPEDISATGQLTAAVDSLRIAPSQPPHTSFATRPLRLRSLPTAPNTLGITAISLDATSEGVVVTVDGATAERVVAPYGTWQADVTRLWPHEEVDTPVTMSSAGWLDDLTLEVRQLLVETPFTRTWRFVFGSDGSCESATVRLTPGFWTDTVDELISPTRAQPSPVV